MSGAVAGVDVGGTTIKASLVTRDGSAERVLRVATPSGDASGERTADAVAAVLDGLQQASGVTVTAAGVAVPGVVDTSTGTCLVSANLGWRDVALGALVAQRTRVPLSFAHDVRAGALAEARVGAARDARGPVAFIAVGTGIAVAVVHDGTPLLTEPWAGEIGQVAVGTAGLGGAGGPLPTLEAVASAASLQRRTGRSGEQVVTGVSSGDPESLAVWDELTTALAHAVAWVTALCGTPTVVLGGGLAESGDVLVQPVQRKAGALVGVLQPPRVVRAALGDLAGSIGAGLLAHDAHHAARRPTRSQG